MLWYAAELESEITSYGSAEVRCARLWRRILLKLAGVCRPISGADNVG